MAETFMPSVLRSRPVEEAVFGVSYGKSGTTRCDDTNDAFPNTADDASGDQDILHCEMGVWKIEGSAQQDVSPQRRRMACWCGWKIRIYGELFSVVVNGGVLFLRGSDGAIPILETAY
jgi:hypothetical protein